MGERDPVRGVFWNEHRTSRGGRRSIEIAEGFGDGFDFLFPLLLQSVDGWEE